MKKLSVFLCFIAFSSSIFAQTTPIPDAVFEAKLIALGIDSNGETGDILNSDAQGIISMDISLMDITPNISDLTGIEAFVNLEILDCRYNSLTNIDLSLNSHLKQLKCRNNEITNLDLTANQELEILNCMNNSIAQLTVSSSIIEITCYNNLLTNLNVDSYTVLQTLDCGKNLLSTIDVSNNTQLEILRIDENQFSVIDVSNNLNLSELSCYTNTIAQLDLSNNTNLTQLYCLENELTELNLINNTNLSYLWCDYNQISSLDLHYNTQLESFWCSNNNLSYLNLKSGNNLILTDVDATSNPDLAEICVDDIAFSTENWLVDATTSFSLCLDDIINTAANDFKINNPVREILTIAGTVQSIEIKDYSGKILRSSHGNSVNINDFSVGFYFVTFTTPSGQKMTRKIVKI